MEGKELWLGVAEVVVNATIPLAILAAGYFVNRALKTREHELASLRRRRDLRKEIYDTIGPSLNRIYCYVRDFGDYGNYEPREIVELKRGVDRQFFTYKGLWSPTTIEAYNHFMEVSFAVGAGGLGSHALIRAPTAEKKQFFANLGKTWNKEWDGLFAESVRGVGAAYSAMVESFIEEVAGDASA